MFETMEDFTDYVSSFYLPSYPDVLYPIQGLTKRMVEEASFLYLQMCCYPSFPHYTWGDGDSLDREHVRDIILENPKFDDINRFTLSGV